MSADEERRARSREASRRYYDANREQQRERKRAYYEANREQILERQRLYYDATREQQAELKRAYRKANPTAIREASRRARETLIPAGPGDGLPWLAGEDEQIMDYSRTAAEHACLLGRSEVAVQNRRRRLKAKGQGE